MPEQKLGRPPIDIEPLLSAIRESPFRPAAKGFKERFPKEWRTARRRGVIQTHTPSTFKAVAVVEIVDPATVMLSRKELINRVREALRNLPDPFYPIALIKAIPLPEGYPMDSLDSEILFILKYLVKRGELSLIEGDKITYAKTAKLGTKPRGRVKSPHPFREMLTQLACGPIQLTRLTRQFSHPLVTKAREEGLIEKFFDMDTEKVLYRFTQVALDHPDFPENSPFLQLHVATPTKPYVTKSAFLHRK